MASLVAPISTTTARPPAVKQTTKRKQPQQLATALRRWFGVDFAVLDTSSGELLAGSNDILSDWLLRADLSAEVARRARAEFILDEEPMLVLAVPLPGAPDPNVVAVRAFLTRVGAPETRFEELGRLLGQEPAVLAQWAQAESPIAPTELLRLAELALAKLLADARIDELESEVETLSVNLGSTYEEISLIYRLTHNLKLSSSEQELCQQSLTWLADVPPVESLAILLTGPRGSELPHEEATTHDAMLTHGPCPLGQEQFSALIEEVGVHALRRPVVLNHVADLEDRPELEGVRQLVLVPIGEVERHFGWLAAINHEGSEEFGTVEASMLSSVSMILAVHCGNSDLYRQQADLLASVVRAMTSAIDAKDPYTHGHSDRVARISVRLARELGCDNDTQSTIYFAGLLHDIGKIGIDDTVLRKPGKLTDAEFEHIKTHSEIGHRILKDLKKMGHVLPVVLHHHEAWDGKGYPYGLVGENIPYLARIVSVADAYDAMASDRPYRQGMEDEKLDSIIRAGAGRQWDARVVDAFFRVRDDIRCISKQTDHQFVAPEWT